MKERHQKYQVKRLGIFFNNAGMVNRHRSAITSLGLYFFFAKPHANLQILLKSYNVCGIILHNKIT